MTIEELYQRKGELSFQIQIAQAKLQLIDQELIKIENEKNSLPSLKKDSASA